MHALPQPPSGRAARHRARRRLALVLLGLLLTLGGLLVFQHEREGLHARTEQSLQTMARALQGTLSQLLAQSALSLQGMRSDLLASIAPEQAAMAAMRYDPLSAYLGYTDLKGHARLMIDRQGAARSDLLGLALPTSGEPGIALGSAMQIPGDTHWYVPLTLPLPVGSKGGDQAVALLEVAQLIGPDARDRSAQAHFISLLDLQGRFLVTDPIAPSFDVAGVEQRLAPSLLRSILAKRMGSARTAAAWNGNTAQPMLLGYSASDTFAYVLVVGTSVSAVDGRWLRETLSPGLGLFMSLALFLLAGLYLRGQWRDRHAYAASRDRLTGLLNRAAFMARVQQSLKSPMNQGFSVLLVNLNRFKSFNDTLGQAAGDALLVETGRRLRSAFQTPQVLLARLGADEFAIFTTAHPTWLSEKGLLPPPALSRPVRLAGTEQELSISVGLALYPQDAVHCDELMRRAGVALRQAKSELKTMARYNLAFDDFSPEMLGLRSDFARALREASLTLVYQPKVRLADGRIAGAEALTRWRHASRGDVTPQLFVPLAENSELIHEFSQFVLDTALQQLAQWLRLGVAVPVAVNLSVNKLLDPGFVAHLEKQMQRFEVPAQYLELEVTESAVMRHPQQALQALHALRGLGIKLSLDDFGTGYASLAYLKQLPLQCLKIDRFFVEQLDSDAANQRIVRGAIELAHGFGMDVVAEGVEDPASAQWLKAHGCEMAQGYFYSRPLPAAQLQSQWLDRAQATSEPEG
jgi:diguanylate cyclase (GGDEF)-like protein